MSNVTPITAAKKRHVAVVKQDFEFMQRQAKQNGWAANCEGQHVLFTEYRVRPSVEDAADMCRGCPMMAGGNLCAEWGVATRADGVVLGGFAFVLGKPVLDDAEAHATYDDYVDLPVGKIAA